ncbi:MAG: effector-associated domain EAD1-containing protein [Polyangiaceae bacterium]
MSTIVLPFAGLMNLSGKEKAMLRDALWEAFPTYEELEMMLAIELETKITDVTVRVPGKLLAWNVVVWAMVSGNVHALVHGALRQSTADCPLLKAAFAHLAATGHLPPARQGARPSPLLPLIPAAPPPPVPPPAKQCIINGLALIDKEAVWNALVDVESTRTRRVLFINGPDECGKSFVSEMIMHVADHYGCALAEVKLGSSHPGPLQRASSLLIETGAGTAGQPPVDGDGARAIESLASWVVSRWDLLAKPQWLIIDGPSRAERERGASVPPSDIDLLKHIARKAYVKRCPVRLAFLGAEPTIADFVGSGAARLQVEHIDADDVACFFKALFRERGEDAEDACFQAIAEEVLASAPPKGPLRTALLPDRILAAARRLFEVAVSA